MLAEFIVMFRESIEAALIVGIMLAYLHKTKNQEHEKHVYLGVAWGIIASIVVAYAFQFVQGGFEAHEELFEGIFMIIATALVTWFILWMMENKKIADIIRHNVQVKLDSKQTTGLMFLAFTSVFREGIEAVLFMAGISVSTGSLSLAGGFLGVVAALIIGYLIFERSMRFDLGKFFKITTVLLIFIAAGLFSHGIHELAEAKLLPPLVEHLWDINPPQNPDSSYPLLHEKGVIGSMAKALFGYDGNPSLLRVLAYIGYLGSVYAISRRYK